MLKKILAALFLSLNIIVNMSIGNAETNFNVNSDAQLPNHPLVQIEMQDGGKMILELYPEYAPLTVKNFIELANSRFL